MDEPNEEIEIELPPPPAHVWLLGGVFLLLLLFALYFARTVMVPIVSALVLYLLLQPALRALSRLRVPRLLAALLILVLLMAGAAAVVALVASPAASWVERAPQSLARLEARMAPVKQVFDRMQKASEHVEKMAEGQPSGEVPVVVREAELLGGAPARPGAEIWRRGRMPAK